MDFKRIEPNDEIILLYRTVKENYQELLKTRNFYYKTHEHIFPLLTLLKSDNINFLFLK